MNPPNESLETLLLHHKESSAGPVAPPIYQTSIFQFESWEAIDRAFDDPVNNSIYTRGNNTTVALVEEKIALMCGGEKAKLFASGMGAISSAILSCIQHGDHIISVKNVYGPTNNFLNQYLKKKCNVETTFVSGENVADFESAIRKNTKLIYLESPASAVFSLQDLQAVATLAKKHSIKTIVDNTCATPIFQQPLALGIDSEIHSCSKYLNGHSDVIAGVVIGKQEAINSIFLQEHAWLGAAISPFDAWLILRGLRTLKIRMLQHQHNAMKVAEFLSGHAKIKHVNYTGLSTFNQKDLAQKQMTGHSGLLSFEIASNDLTKIKQFFNALKYFRIAVSWGGYESLIYAPAISYLKELPEEQFKALGISLGVMRVSIGLENADDLIKDLDEALRLI